MRGAKIKKRKRGRTKKMKGRRDEVSQLTFLATPLTQHSTAK